VTPKRDCPHCTPENIAPKEEFKGVHVNDPCPDCGNVGENWVSLKPGSKVVKCSRYVRSHMLEYFEETNYPIAFSFADFSYWCFICDSYVEHPLLDHAGYFFEQKFAECGNDDKAVFARCRKANLKTSQQMEIKRRRSSKLKKKRKTKVKAMQIS